MARGLEGIRRLFGSSATASKRIDPPGTSRAKAGAPAPESKPGPVGDGFASPGQEGVTQERDRRRLFAKTSVIPEVLSELAKAHDVAGWVARVRAGEPAISVAEKMDLGESLSRLPPDQLKALREALVERPPHPLLKQMRGHPALKGAPSARGIVQILCGEPWGKGPIPSPDVEHKAREAIEVIARNLSPREREQWVAILRESDAATTLVARNGVHALEAINALGVEGIEAAGHAWTEGAVLLETGLALEGGFPRLKAHLDEVGFEGFRDTIAGLSQLSWNGAPIYRSVPALGLEGAATLGRLVEKDSHGFRALKILAGSEEGAFRALRKKSLKGMERVFAEATKRIPAFGAHDTPLYSGASWPALDPPRTAKVIAAEAEIAGATGLSLTDRDRSSLSEAELGTLSRALKDRVARNPELAEKLERELLGRRFVSHRYYDALYAQGVENPEHRYSDLTFRSWRAAESVVRAKAAETRGRPLAEGELTALLTEAHRLAGAGMIEAAETHMKPGDLGRLRSRDEDHVQLGGQFMEVDRETEAKLDRNPYLTRTPALTTTHTDQPRLLRPIIFAKGSEVPRLVAELDRWVRDHEGKLPASELAAEVHFRLVSIHPFMDGNGRTAKLMADFLLLRAGAEPPLWRKDDVLKNRDTWPRAAHEGLEVELATVERYFRTAEGGGP